MGASRLTEQRENIRQHVVESLDKETLRQDAALKRVADAVSSVCDVPMAQVSLMETEHQCVVGHVGMEMSNYDRDNTFCAYTIVENEVVIVEDAAEHEQFYDNPFVTGEANISFYVGLPLVVEDTPVGTLCAIDTEPRELDLESRTELFGLVNVVESHLDVVYQHGSQTPEHGISSKLTAIRALTAKESVRGPGESDRRESLRGIEAEASTVYKEILQETTDEDEGLDAADTDVDADESIGLGFAETDVEWM